MKRRIPILTSQEQLARLCRIGLALSVERDLPRLLEIILSEARSFTNAEGGTLYLREGEFLDFILFQNDVLAKRDGVKPSHYWGQKIPLSKGSLAGHVASTGQPLNIEDAYALPSDSPFATHFEFDKVNNYRTTSILVVPMKDLSGEVIGVIQLINARSAENQIVPFDKTYEDLLSSLASQAAVSIRNARLTAELHEAYLDTLYRLALAAEYRGDDTAGHIRRMSHYSAIIANAYGLPPEEVEAIRIASPMHDIGKIAVPDAILLKPGPLTPVEFEAIKKHPEIGARILGNSRTSLLRLAETIALTHHEKFDGRGYPHGLKGAAIPLPGRIVSAADVFDALTTKRVYKEAMPEEQARDLVASESGKGFDPDVVKAFLKDFDKVLSAKQQHRDDRFASNPPQEPTPLSTRWFHTLKQYLGTQ